MAEDSGTGEGLKVRGKPMLLWVGPAVTAGENELPDQLVPRFLQQLQSMGIDIRFLPVEFHLQEGVEERLMEAGIEVLAGDWYRQNLQHWLKAHERAVDYVCFESTSNLDETLTTVLSLARAASVCLVRQLPKDTSASAGAKQVFNHADLLLALDPKHCQSLQDAMPCKQVLAYPDSEEQARKALSVARRASLPRVARQLESASPKKPPRVIAFYLPQYHPIPENDAWWGEGFTEWRNVKKTRPLFEGHYQPHVPADLGYYDLRNEESRIAQADLARQYGVEGFCYYHYWFNGKRLLEGPMEALLESGKPDFPFCICWANEHWSRRWDGKDQEILQRQEYSEEDDLAHIQYLVKLFSDPRYIRISGKPLVLVYRAENLPDTRKTARIWREQARRAGLDGLYLCSVESFVKADPREYGFDMSIEFAPDWWNKGPQLTADAGVFKGNQSRQLKTACKLNYIHSYEGLADAMMAKPRPGYKWARCVTPSWDNWARRHEGASVFLGSTPEKYQNWLTHVVEDTDSCLHGDERLVFVNAWNEWAEGNHLEPDEKFGHGYLQATRAALFEGMVAGRLKRLVSRDEERMHELSSLASTQDVQLTELRHQLMELRHQMAELLASTSWRVSAPLRWVKQGILALQGIIKKQ